MIRRRDWVIAAVAYPASAMGPVRAAPASKVYRIAVLDPDPASFAGQWHEFVAELARRGYVEGRNVSFERRFGEELRPDVVARLALDLVALKPDVIYAAHGTLSALALKKATKTIPIVFYSSGDPVGTGLVASLARPGGNLTGNAISSFETFPKSLQYLKEILGKLSRVVEIQTLGTRELPWFAQMDAAVMAAAGRLGAKFEYVDVSSMEDVEREVARLAREGVDAVTFGGGNAPQFRPHMRRIAALFVEHRLPSIGDPEEGFLLQYQPNFAHIARKSAEYVDRILRGARVADLPVEQVSEFELSINRKTADAIGLKIPGPILLRADRVIR